MPSYDAIVLGCGGVGSAALYHLARRGLRVLGLDRFPPAHDRGSSHGSTRIIRQAYFEHPDYVPLLLRAYALWHDLEQQSGKRLFTQIGLLQVGPRDGTVVQGVLQSARQHSLAVELLNNKEAADRFPAFAIGPALASVFEPAAGSLAVEACVRAHLAGAVAAGAVLRCGVSVQHWNAESPEIPEAGVRVVVDGEAISAARLIVTAGPWAAQLLGDLDIRLRVERRVQLWYPTDLAAQSVAAGCPAFLFELPHGIFYGFPAFDARGVKVAEHTGDEPVADPLQLDRQLHQRDRERVEAFLADSLAIHSRCSAHSVCMYTMTPDQHFIVDRHPRYPQVALAAGLSGHGFKFSGVLGEALADLAIDGRTELPIGFLCLDRPALRPPA